MKKPRSTVFAPTDAEARARRVKRLGRTGQNRPDKLALVISALDDADELARVEAAEACGRIGDREALPALRRALGDRSPLVRSYAAGAIGELGDRSFLRVLHGVAKDEKSDTALVGYFSAMYVLGDVRAVRRLTELLNSPDYRVRSAVASTLANVVTHPSEATDGIRAALERALAAERTRAARVSLTRAIHRIDMVRAISSPARPPRTKVRQDDRNHKGLPRPGQDVILTRLPPGLVTGLPRSDQNAIRAIVGKPVKLVEYDSDGRAELQFVDKAGTIHFIYVAPSFVRAVRPRRTRG